MEKSGHLTITPHIPIQVVKGIVCGAHAMTQENSIAFDREQKKALNKK